MCNFSTFWCGFYSSGAFIWGRLICKILSLQSPKKQSGTCKNESETWHCDCSNVMPNGNKHLACEKRKDLSYIDDTRPRFLSCRFYSSAAYVQLEFAESAASIQVRLMCNLSSQKVRLLFKCGLCATWVRRKCGFYSSSASNQVRLLYTTLRFVHLVWLFTVSSRWSLPKGVDVIEKDMPQAMQLFSQMRHFLCRGQFLLSCKKSMATLTHLHVS